MSQLTDDAALMAQRAQIIITGRKPRHVIFCGAPRAGKTTAYASLRTLVPTDIHAPEHESSALKTIRRFSAGFITDRALDLFSAEKISSTFTGVRDLHFIVCVRDPRSLVCANQTGLSAAKYFQGFDYQFFWSSNAKSYSYPGVVVTLKTALRLTKETDLTCSFQKYEDFVSDPVNTTIRLASKTGLLSPESIPQTRRAILEQSVKDAQVDERDVLLWLRPEHRDRVLRQLHLCPELEELAVALGYLPASEYGIDLSAPPPPAIDGTIIAFHTDDEVYRKEAQRFTRRLDQLGLKHDITVVPPRGEWVENCAMKPEFILEARKRLRGPLLYLDVDSFVHADPWPYLSLYDGHMSAYIHKTGELLSGTIMIDDSPKAVELLETWVREQKEAPKIYDQKVLQNVIEADEKLAEPRFSFQRLPPNFCFIPGKEYPMIFGEIIVEQLQVSRVVKRGGRGELMEKRIAELRRQLE